MVSLPATENPLVVRTDFSDPGGWEATRKAILAPGAEAQLFTAYVEFIDDEGFAGYTPEQVLALVTDQSAARHGCLFIVDKATVNSSGWPVLVMDLETDRGRVFRAIADEVHSIAANIPIGNMDFAFYADFAEQAGGVFRGGGPPRSEVIARLREAAQSGKWPGKFMENMLKPGPPAQ